MRIKCIIILFMFIFSNGFSSEIQFENINEIKERISSKEAELRELKDLLKKLDEEKKSKKETPKIGLVLSGGGAKGLAHVGVLKVLEEYNIPIDYITGTSFGSIIGGLYASGYTADEIDKIVHKIDWNSYKGNDRDREYSSLLFKVEREKYFLNLEIDKNWKLKFPNGVLTGQSFYLELKSLLSNVEGIENFDNLKIPFRAISTNINTGEAVAQGKGDLAKAIFKSMAFPTVFQPVEDNGEFYVDGGVTDNMPVEAAIDLGADIIIAVDISADEVNIEEDSSLIKIMDKMSTYRSSDEFKKSIELSDILISPDVKSYSVADFADLEIIIKKGEIETRKHKKELMKYSEKRKRKLAKAKVKEKQFEIEELVLVNNHVITKKKIMFFSSKKLPNKYSQEELELWMNKINALSIINRFFYTIEGKKLIIDVHEKETKHLRLGLNASSDFGVAFKAATEISNYGILKKDYIVTAEVSSYPKLELRGFSEYKFNKVQYIGSLGIGAKSSPLFIYDKDDNISNYKSKDFYIDGILGTAIFNSYAIGIKGEAVTSNIEYDDGSKEFDSGGTKNYYKGSLFLESDTRDNSHFSSKGGKASVYFYNGGGLESEENIAFNGFLFDIHRNFKIKTRFNLELFTTGGIINGEVIPEEEYYKIGGLRNDINTNQFSFYGMNAMRKYADEFYMGGINLRYKLISDLYLNARYNVITYTNSEELSNYDNSRVGEDFKQGIGLALGWDSLAGPFEIVISNDADSNGMLFSAFLGYEF